MRTCQIYSLIQEIKFHLSSKGRFIDDERYYQPAKTGFKSNSNGNRRGKRKYIPNPLRIINLVMTYKRIKDNLIKPVILDIYPEFEADARPPYLDSFEMV